MLDKLAGRGREHRPTLCGVTVAITGGARGIGRATAAEFVRQGSTVAIGDLDGELAVKAAAELSPRCLGLRLDVTDAGSLAGFLQRVEDQLARSR